MTKFNKDNKATTMIRTGAIIVGHRKGYKQHPLDGADELRLDRMFGLLDAAIEASGKSKGVPVRKPKK